MIAVSRENSPFMNMQCRRYKVVPDSDNAPLALQADWLQATAAKGAS